MLGNDDDHDDLAALDFSATDDDNGEESAVDALRAYAPTGPEDTETELDALRLQTGQPQEEDEEDAVQLFTVTNPPETVSVSALIDGRIDQVDLSEKVTSMTESELAEEILVIADLARQKGLAGRYTYLLEEDDSLPDALREMESDGCEAVHDFVNGMALSTPEQATAAQAEVFATRYATDN
ncbi:hypothetical protein AWC15_07715 [Mycobacterium lacus]|nr:hypothetical protein AWC15_07715 [Mycobacterium lacus]